MRIPILATLAILALAGCARDAELKPAPSAQQIPGDDFAAIDTVAGVTVTVDGDAWSGTPEDLDTVVPVRVTIQNNSDQPLRLRYSELALMGPQGSRFAALPPLSIDGTATVYAPVDDELGVGVGGAGLEPLEGPLDPEFDYDGYYVSPTYGTFWTEPSPWGGPFEADPFYYDTWYARWPVELPTLDMVAKALPEGVLSPGGQVSGFIYFQDVPKGMDRVRFRYQLVNAETGEQFGTLSIPFITQDV